MIWLLLACTPAPLSLGLDSDPPTTDTHPEDPVPEDEICDDGIDNDGDGDVDCYDHDCAFVDSCDEDCTDGVDNDGDGYTDCADYECRTEVFCIEDCFDGIDNDLDLRTDCEDDDCVGQPPCIEDCTDEIDNDLDGLTDCADSDCPWDDPSCLEDCTDGIDNDVDGLVDCEDSYCTELCSEPSCSDGIDTDEDGYLDCEDDDCWGRPPCGHTLWISPRSGSYQGTLSSWDYTDPEQSDRASHYGRLSGLSGWVGISAFHHGSGCEFEMDSLVATEVHSAGNVSFQVQANNLQLSSACGIPLSSLVFSGTGTEMGLRFDGPELVLADNGKGLIYAYYPHVEGYRKNTSALRFKQSTMNFGAYGGNNWSQEVPGL